jgi:hypothetical protein
VSSKDKREIEAWFPRLKASGYGLTSPIDHRYNCIAYAAGDDKKFWDPLGASRPGGAWYWPAGFPADTSLTTLCEIFEFRGYEKCADGSIESGYEKVALYVKDGLCAHAAKQLPDGAWSSKLGKGRDIRHDEARGVGGDKYGEVVQYLRRPITAANPGIPKVTL